jgi:hypothetical protein
MHRILATSFLTRLARVRAPVQMCVCVCVCVVLAGFHPIHLEFVRVFLLLCVGLFACPALSISLYVCACVRA